MGCGRIPQDNLGPVTHKGNAVLWKICLGFIADNIGIAGADARRIATIPVRFDIFAVHLQGGYFREGYHLPEGRFLISQQVGKHFPVAAGPDGGGSVPQEMDGPGRIGQFQVGLERIGVHLLFHIHLIPLTVFHLKRMLLPGLGYKGGIDIFLEITGTAENGQIHPVRIQIGFFAQGFCVRIMFCKHRESYRHPAIRRAVFLFPGRHKIHFPCAGQQRENQQ